MILRNVITISYVTVACSLIGTDNATRSRKFGPIFVKETQPVTYIDAKDAVYQNLRRNPQLSHSITYLTTLENTFKNLTEEKQKKYASGHDEFKRQYEALSKKIEICKQREDRSFESCGTFAAALGWSSLQIPVGTITWILMLKAYPGSLGVAVSSGASLALVFTGARSMYKACHDFCHNGQKQAWREKRTNLEEKTKNLKTSVPLDYQP